MEPNRDTNPKLEQAEEDLTEEDVQIWSEIRPSKPEASVEIGEKQGSVYHHGDASRSTSSSDSPCIFRTPFPGLQFQEPQLASVGPYHRTKTLPLEKFKYFLLRKFISRTENQGKDLRFYVQQMMGLEWRARRCYSEDLSMSSPEFVEIMLVDGCFIMEVLGHFGKSGGSEDWFFPIEPWQLPILVQDLLMLENQIPFFVLKMLFDSLEMESEEGTATVSLPAMALKFFDLAFPRSMDIGCKFNHWEANHLLDLFLESIRPSNPSTDLNPIHLFLNTIHMKTMVIPKLVFSFLRKINTRNQAGVSMKAGDIHLETPATNPKLKDDLSPMQSQSSISKRVQHEQKCGPPPPFHFTKNVMKLRASGIELRPRRAARFTDIIFKNGMLEIPPVTIDDLFIATIINCVAFEHSFKRCSKDLSAYVSFMSGLIRNSSDAELLCSNGIISRFSHKDKKVIDSFCLLRTKILDMDIQDSYLFKRLKEIECYYSRAGKSWCWRYWRIYFFCITTLLFAFKRLSSGVNLMIHFVQEAKFPGVYADFLGDMICSQRHSSFICDSVFLIVRFIYNSARGRVKSIDLGLHKFMVFFFLNSIIVCEIPPPTLTVHEQDIKVEDSVTVDEQGIEVGESVNRRETSADDATRVSGFVGTETVSIVDCMSKMELYNMPWSKIEEMYSVIAFQGREVEESVNRRETSADDATSVSGFSGTETVSIVGCMSKDKPWSIIPEEIHSLIALLDCLRL